MSIYSNYTWIFKSCVKNATQGKKQPKSGRILQIWTIRSYEGEGTWFSDNKNHHPTNPTQ